MVIEEFFKLMSYGQLSNLAMANEGSGTIVEGSRAKVLSYLNEGLMTLYSRFFLREKELVIRLVSGKTIYEISSRYSQSGHIPETPDAIYIMDILNPYQNDWIKALQIFSQHGRELPLNDSENFFSIFTPSPTILQIPNVGSGDQTITVLYQARHPRLIIDDLNGEILLPDVLMPALTSYVASKVFSHMNGKENSQKGQEHYALFDSQCIDVSEKDLVGVSGSTTNTNFERKGWI